MPNEPEAFPSDVLVEEEPRYLRRQKPLEIRRRRFGRRSWQLSKRILVGGAAALAGGWLLYQIGHFLLYSPGVILAHSDQLELIGNHYMARAAVVEKFGADIGRSVLRIPLPERRKAIERLGWVEQASVERVLPNRIRVALVERKPIAFLRLSHELALIDAHGVILERPLGGEFHFPVVAGISEVMLPEERERRVKLYVDFLREIELVQTGAAGKVSEVDLSDGNDLRATLAESAASLAGAGNQETVLVHFGNEGFAEKFRGFVENIRQWQASAGRVESVDLRFARQVVVNPETRTTTARTDARFRRGRNPE